MFKGSVQEGRRSGALNHPGLNSLVSHPRRPRQRRDGHSFVFLLAVRIDVERQANVRMPGECLSDLRANTSPLQIRDEEVPATVEVGVEPGLVAIGQKVRLGATLLFSRSKLSLPPPSHAASFCASCDPYLRERDLRLGTGAHPVWACVAVTTPLVAWSVRHAEPACLHVFVCCNTQRPCLSVDCS
jgi:hypothetical protein